MDTRSHGWAVLLSVAIVGSVLLAHQAPASAQTTPPDVIDLANGGMVRGTVVENIPGDHVTIQLATGEIRTYLAADVTRVGSATSDAPRLAVPAPRDPAPAPRAHVRVEAELAPESDPVLLHRLLGSATLRGSGLTADSFEPVCPLPCEFDTAPGTYIFGYSIGHETPRRFDATFDLSSDATLSLITESHADERLIGGIVLAAGILGGVAIALGAYFGTGANVVGFSNATIIGVSIGGIVMVASIIAGSVMASRRDEMTLHDGALHF